jgi:hypothetical protein
MTSTPIWTPTIWHIIGICVGLLCIYMGTRFVKAEKGDRGYPSGPAFLIELFLFGVGGFLIFVSFCSLLFGDIFNVMC